MPDLVPPEIENLRDCATRPDGGSLTQFEAFIPLADAEAAVLACEKRMRQQVHFLPAAPLDAETTELAFIEGIAFVNAAKHEQTVDLMRVRTVRVRDGSGSDTAYEHTMNFECKGGFDAQCAVK